MTTTDHTSSRASTEELEPVPAAPEPAAAVPAAAVPAAAQTPRRGRPGHDVGAVIDAGIRVFTERGYDGATMDDIATVLGIAKSSVYHHVSGKEEILQRALDRALGALEAVFDEVSEGRVSASPVSDSPVSDSPVSDSRVSASGVSTKGQLESVVRRSVATLVAELPSVALLLRVRGTSDVQRAALARRRTLDARLANLVIQAQIDGAIRADLDPHLVARLVFGTVNSLTEWYRPRADGAAEEVDAVCALADTVCALVFDGLRVSESGVALSGGALPGGALSRGAN